MALIVKFGSCSNYAMVVCTSCNMLQEFLGTRAEDEAENLMAQGVLKGFGSDEDAFNKAFCVGCRGTCACMEENLTPTILQTGDY